VECMQEIECEPNRMIWVGLDRYNEGVCNGGRDLVIG
jgi:hypothetical protein